MVMGGGSGGGGGLVPSVSQPVLFPSFLKVPSGGYGSSRSTLRMVVPISVVSDMLEKLDSTPKMDVPAVSDVPASLDLSMLDLSVRTSILIGISPPDMRARILSPSVTHLVKVYGPEGVGTERESSGGKPFSCLLHHKAQGCQDHGVLEMSVGQGPLDQ
jgi:hypothetical protein